MDTFTLDIGRSWVVRALGRNPLTRWTDRLEAVLTLCLIAVAILLIPVAGAIGTAVHESRAGFYAKESAGRHVVTATAVEDSTLTFENVRVAATAQVRWRAEGADHVDILFVDPATKAGDRLTIWVDRAGNHVSAPTARWQAGRDAFLAGAGVWLGTMAVALGLWGLVRVWFFRIRARSWDRAFRVMADEDGGRTGRQS